MPVMRKQPSLTEGISIAAAGENSVTFVQSAADGGTEERVSWAELHNDAKAAASFLRNQGLRPGEHVAILGLTSRALVTAIQAVWLAGGCVIILPIPMRMGSIGEFINQTRAHIFQGDAKFLLIDQALLSLYEKRTGDPTVISLDLLWQENKLPEKDNFQIAAPDDKRLAILQFTSGSTSAPKGVMLPDRTICNNINAMKEKVELDLDRDVMVSWLPLYHDMGLIGILTTAMYTGCNLIISAP